MAKTRALLTETEREQIAGEHGSDRKYQATSRVRARIEEELTQDIEVLEEHHPDLLEELRDVVCSRGESITYGRATIAEGDRYEVIGPVPIEGAEEGRTLTVQDIVTPIGDENAGLLIQIGEEEEFQYTPLHHVAEPVNDGRLVPPGDHDAA